MRRARSRSWGFTLLEVMFSVVIVATALLGLQAAITGSITTATESVTRRAARALVRSKMEEVLAGVIDPDGSGTFSEEGYDNFSWESRAEEMAVGGAGDGEPTEKVRKVTVTISFPSEEGTGTTATIVLVSAVAAEEETGQ